MTLAGAVTVGFDRVAKSFGQVQVLHDVSFDLPAGQVYGLIGENGAGKSTLMKILAGYETPSLGCLRVNGEYCHFSSSRAAEALGIVLIHQEFNLADDLTVAQNIFLGHELRRGWWLDEAAMARESTAALAAVGLQIAPGTRVRRLIVAEKQLVEIAKAVVRRARLLIMDEPTATLTPGETERLFQLIARLRSEGVTILFISHKLDEIERLCDEVLVMRDGRLVARRPRGSVTRQEMASLMVGRELADLFPPRVRPMPGQPPLLEVRDFSVPGWVSQVTFAIAPGEILGFAGLVGAGRTELFEGLLGLRAGTGAVALSGRMLPARRGWRDPRAAARDGLTYLSEDRKGKGLHIAFGLRQNLTLMALGQFAHPWLRPETERGALVAAVERYGIRTGALELRASSLSGGNQQKLALAKVLQPGPRVVVLDEPTRGVDVGAKRDLYFLIQQLARSGLGVIVVSSELMELIGLCHRVAVMRTGELVATLDAAGLTEEELIAHATGTANAVAA